MKLFAIAGIASALALGTPPPGAFANPQTVASEQPVMDKVVELMEQIRKAKSLPEWAMSTAMSAFDVYKTYRNGEKVEHIDATLLTVLKEVADMKANADAGREMTEREYRLTRELFDAYGLQLQSHESRLGSVEKDVRVLRQRLDSLEPQRRAQTRAGQGFIPQGRVRATIGRPYR